MGSTTVVSDGSVLTQIGSFSSDGSTGMGSTSTVIGVLFNDRIQDTFGIDSQDVDDKWLYGRLATHI